ncbi:hypothetical protein CDG76_32420 [Nostoc sp. 'Peltigera membranacea cyanobiont' 210A]|nr:hypothetical protein CDG76_32420 [Nostoc sp. 'Peltigera membranacea cyanobiont' 210A]
MGDEGQGRNQFKIQNDALYETLRERGLANAALTKFKIKEFLPSAFSQGETLKAICLLPSLPHVLKN